MSLDTSLTEAVRFEGIELSLMRRIIAAAPKGATNLALGELSYELPVNLKEEAQRLLDEHTPRYTPNAGLLELREQIAALYEDAILEQAIVTNGAQEALFLSLFSLINPGDTVAVLEPDYPAYTSILKLLGAQIVRIPMNRDLRSVDWERHWEFLEKEAKAFILSSPNNPSGFFLKDEDADCLEAICSNSNLAVIVDETYRGLCFAGSPATLSGRVENLFTIGSLSKTHCMSGFRLGWVVVPENFSATLTKAKQYVSTCTPSLDQRLAVFALGPGGKAATDQIFIQLLQSRGAALAFLKANWPADTLHIPDATPYIMLRCDRDDVELAEQLASMKVIVTPGSAFGANTAQMLRINYAIDAEELIPALEIITNELYPH